MSQTQNTQEIVAAVLAALKAQENGAQAQESAPAEQMQNTQENFSQRYKAYKRRQKDAGKTALPFALWKDRYAMRAPRGSKQSQPVQVTQQPDTQAHVTIQNPDDQATGRQLWKLMDLGLIEFISKGDASQMIEKALA